MRERAFCIIHEEEEGVEIPAVTRDRNRRPLCHECAVSIAQAEADDRRYAAQYAQACGYHD